MEELLLVPYSSLITIKFLKNNLNRYLDLLIKNTNYIKKLKTLSSINLLETILLSLSFLLYKYNKILFI
jgi:hypothetical protein